MMPRGRLVSPPQRRAAAPPAKAPPARHATVPSPAAPHRVPVDEAPPGRLHAAYVVLGLFFSSGAMFDLDGAGTQGDLGSVNPLSTVAQLMILLGGLALGWRHRWRCLAILPRCWPLLLFLAVVALSTLWSDQPSSTFRRSISAFGFGLFIVTTYATFPATRFMRLVLLTMTGTAIAGLVEAVVRPQVGFDLGDYTNAIRGLYYQKNAQGMALLAAVLALGYLVLDRGRILKREVALLLFLMVVLVATRSTTSLLLTIVGIGLIGTIFFFERGGGWRLVALTVPAVAVALILPLPFVLGVADLFDLIGKDASLTGRTFIWAEAWKAIQQKPFLGYGYAAFWVQDTDRVRAIQRVVNWNVPTAHSGYREVMLQLGWLGIAVLLTMLSCTLFRVIRTIRRGPRYVALWTLVFLLLQAILSNNESSLLLLDLNLVIWMFVTFTLANPVASRASRPVMPGRVVSLPWAPGAARQGAS